ncbi:MAG: sigma-70 family RNA polymerase sigma factor, partial [Acidimicrobiales bacterium]|nr:sigma-70 family RNA polymerase sigma factor [Acidimicrobiales bacterium]
MRTWGVKCGEIPHGAALLPQTWQRPPLIALITVPKPRRTSDATLVRRSQQGDRRAFSALLARYDWRLRGLAHALLLDRAEMDVALATGYLRAWRDVVRVDAKEDVAAWLYRVTYNACIDQLRRADNASSSAPSAPSASSAAPAAAAEAASSAGGGIAAGLATLPAAERVAVVLVDREGFSPASAARILGMPESALSVTLDSARERLTPHIPEPDSGAPTVDDAAEPAEASGNGAQPNDPPVEAPARANGATDVATDGDGDATAASDDEDAAPSTDRRAPVEPAAIATDSHGDEVPSDAAAAGPGGTAAATADGDEVPGDDVIAGPSGTAAATANGDEVAGDVAGPG